MSFGLVVTENAACHGEGELAYDIEIAYAFKGCESAKKKKKSKLRC